MAGAHKGELHSGRSAGGKQLAQNFGRKRVRAAAAVFENEKLFVAVAAVVQNAAAQRDQRAQIVGRRGLDAHFQAAAGFAKAFVKPITLFFEIQPADGRETVAVRNDQGRGIKNRQQGRHECPSKNIRVRGSRFSFEGCGHTPAKIARLQK